MLPSEVPSVTAPPEAFSALLNWSRNETVIVELPTSDETFVGFAVIWLVSGDAAAGLTVSDTVGESSVLPAVAETSLDSASVEVTRPVIWPDELVVPTG